MPYRKDLAERVIKWFPRYLKHTKGRWKGQPFKLLPWQKKVIRKIFGTINPDGTRQYRFLYIEIPKKNGKSEFAAGLGLFLCFADHEPGAEIYSAAGDKDQAAIVFNVAADMVRMNKKLGRRCKIIDSTKRIVNNNGSFLRALSADVPTKHGFNCHGIIFDELHAQPNRKLWDVLTYGSGAARLQPLTIVITTAGFDRHSICWKIHERARKVKQGIIEDRTFLAVMYGANEKSDWTNEGVWKKANPALDAILRIEDLRADCKTAQEDLVEENNFRRFRLNQWVKQQIRWIDIARWNKSAGEVFSEDLQGEIAYAGLDLASTIDIAAFVLIFPDEDKSYDVLPFFWVPEDNVEQRVKRDHAPYDPWVEQGFIRITPGDVIDYRYIRRDIKELGEQYHIAEIAYDPWAATQIVQELEDDGFTMVPFRQGFDSMAAPTKELLKLVLGCRLRHGDNPVLTWMADNMVVKQDPAGNVKPDKAKSTEKIDGMVALIMGLDRALRHEGSVYNKRGILSL